MTRVRNIINDRNRAVANQFILFDDDRTIFQSYDSTIIVLLDSKNEMYIYPDYDYSMTTGRYRNMFLRDWGFPDLDTLKELNKAIKSGIATDDNGNEWKVYTAF